MRTPSRSRPAGVIPFPFRREDPGGLSLGDHPQHSRRLGLNQVLADPKHKMQHFPSKRGATLLAAAFVLAASLPALADSNGTQRGLTEVPELNLGSVTSGRDAIRTLGSHLPDLARAHRIGASELINRFQTDPGLHLDRAGRLFFGCPGRPASISNPANAGTVTLGGTVGGIPPAPLTSTFQLHSRPGTTRVIYLDFNGNTTTGTPWNSSFTGGASFTTPPFDIDGNPAAFSDAELGRIQLIWQRVAEDYAPFDVDVTTQDPGLEGLRKTSSVDTAYGIHVCIGGSSLDWYGTGAGGVSFVGSFDWSSDTPNYVFPAQLANGDEKYTAEAISHEVGHSFALSHDGQSPSSPYYYGQGTDPMTWAPIMGVGYYANIVQWSKGEYNAANNTEDDLAIIASYVGYRPDDHGDTQATATYLPAGAQIAASGLISSQSDVDVIAFTTGAGAVSINLTSGAEDADLDITAELRDSSGQIVATSNPATALGASFNLTLAAGTYFLTIHGTGYLDPLTTGYSAYGSIGTFQITGTVVNPAGSVAPVAVATATPVSGKAPLGVTFNGGGSFDQDGFIIGYSWKFSDGTTASGATVSKVINVAGPYTGTLTVTDNSGLTAAASVVVSVSPANLPPVARITATPTTGYAPLAVTFGGSTSSDPDGTISTYKWTFGDGSTSTLANVTKTYSNIGSYTATLTVTDNSGATGTASVPISVTQDPAKVIRVQSISLTFVSGHGQAVVKASNLNGTAVAGATVTGSWSGVAAGTVTAVTDSTGTATLTSGQVKKTGTLTFTVNSLSKTGLVYDASKNLQGPASVQASAPAGGPH